MHDAISVLLALLPVIVVFLLLVLRRMAADIAGVIGWLLALGIAVWYFQTDWAVALRASASGIIASFPISIVVATSILQVTIMLETGAIARVVALIKTIAPEDRISQIMIINVGFGILLTSLGAVPVSILPPIMMALGYSSFVAIALPAIGYDALCTYALLGVPAVVFADVVGKIQGTPVPLETVGPLFARYMPVITTCIGLGMLWIVGKWRMVWRGFPAALVAGLAAGFTAIGMARLGLVTLTGIAAGLAVMAAMFLFLAVRGRKLVSRVTLTDGDLAAERHIGLWAALSPWILLIVFSVLANWKVLPVYDWTFNRLAMPVEIIPGKPERMRMLWQAYFWILVSTVLALPFLKITGQQMRVSMQKWLKRAPRPMLSAAIFFAIAYVTNHSGKQAGADGAWVLGDPSNNMVHVLATAAASLFGKLYPMVAPFLGLLGGFISGSETSAIAMLTDLHLKTWARIAGETAVPMALLIAAASAIGGGLASVISPAKLQNAAASIDRIGEEGRVIGVTFVISIIITGVCALMTLWWVLG